jgi:hypothetical protein
MRVYTPKVGVDKKVHRRRAGDLISLTEMEVRAKETPDAKVRLTKSERERRVFEALAPLIGWNVTQGSVVQPDPPDIICEVAGHGRLAVELVALDAPETRSRLDNMITTDEAWDRASTTLSVENQERLRIDVNDVFLSIGFRNKAGLRDRTKALQSVQEFLLQYPGYVGVLPPKKTPRVERKAAIGIYPDRIENIVRKCRRRQSRSAPRLEF